MVKRVWKLQITHINLTFTFDRNLHTRLNFHFSLTLGIDVCVCDSENWFYRINFANINHTMEESLRNAWIPNESNLIVHNWVQLLACSSQFSFTCFCRMAKENDDDIIRCVYARWFCEDLFTRYALRVHYTSLASEWAESISFFFSHLAINGQFTWER